MSLIFPNFRRSILNLSCSFAKFLGVDTDYDVLDMVYDQLLGRDKIVFICVDGFGSEILDRLGSETLDDGSDVAGFMKDHKVRDLTSVFPSTTTNATTVLASADSPIQNGWLAWCVYFKEINKHVELFRGKDYYTTEDILPNFVWDTLGYTPYYNKAKSEYTINTVFPRYLTNIMSENNYTFNTTDEQYDWIDNALSKEGKQFVYSYNSTPDDIFHDEGTYGVKSKQVISKINSRLKQLAEKHPEALIVVTADHGHIDVSGYIKIYEDKEFLSFLEQLPFGEPRAMFVNVKKDKFDQFIKYVNKNFDESISIFSREDLISNGIFGKGYKYSHLIGEYVLTINDNRIFLFSEKTPLFKGQHTGLSREEMLVPLIIINGK